MPAGQPTKYTPDMVKKSNAYYEGAWNKEGDMIPSVEGLSEYINISRKTLYNWGDVHEEFLHILEKINTKQKKILINRGLDSTFNSNITKLVLGKHGLSDKQEITGEDGAPIQVEDVSNMELARRIAFTLKQAEKEHA